MMTDRRNIEGRRIELAGNLVQRLARLLLIVDQEAFREHLLDEGIGGDAVFVSKFLDALSDDGGGGDGGERRPATLRLVA
jgi:hypothetical protein